MDCFMIVVEIELAILLDLVVFGLLVLDSFVLVRLLQMLDSCLFMTIGFTLHLTLLMVLLISILAIIEMLGSNSKSLLFAK